MIQTLLYKQLDRLAARYRFLRFWQVLSLVWLAAAILAGGLVLLREQIGAGGPLVVVVLSAIAAVMASVVALYAARLARGPAWTARRIEAAFPELQSRLLAAVEQRPDLPNGEFGYLQSSVIREALEHSRKHPWIEIVPRSRIALAAVANLATLLLFVAGLAGLSQTIARAGSAPAAVKPPAAQAAVTTVTVEPGSVEIEKGTSLLVLARMAGPMPLEATLVVQPREGDAQYVAMSASLDDPLFGGRVPDVREPFRYYVEFADQSSPEYEVHVFEFPQLISVDARLKFPAYTKLDDRLIQDIRTLSVVEGTQVTLRCRLNKPVVSAVLTPALETDTAPGLTLAAGADPHEFVATLEARESRKFKLHLTDDAGRHNKKPDLITINVTPNRPPTLKPLFPARDSEVSPLEELELRAETADDFGILKTGVTYSIAGQPPVEVVVLEGAAAREKHALTHLLRFETLKAEPDQLLSYYWWVEDADSSGVTRRTDGDMYFAEVRTFEEIYRQGEQPPGGQNQRNQQGQGQNVPQAQELAKLQKDIINATWKLIRRESGAKLTDAFAPDVGEVKSSQQTARQQAEALAEEVQDEQSQAHVEAVLAAMETAIKLLEDASAKPSATPLTEALAAEQAAYQALLRLRAREHEVVRQQQQSGQPGQPSASRSQQQQAQLNQLDLKEDENRYETQRAAQAQQEETPEQRENRQLLSRLSELARRQHDLNERLKELQSALEEAQTPAEREEVQRQLQRLQDEQKQVLEDTDELQSRMDQQPNPEEFTQERQQLQETRDQVQRAAESLKEERVSQAAAAGTRAEQQFDNLREEFRRRTSNQFAEEMQTLRQEAREIDEKQQQITEEIKNLDKPAEGAPTLREDNRKEQVGQALAEQRQRLTNLQEEMRTTIERAEQTEPILSQRLYDTARNLRDESIDKALRQAQRSVQQGLTEDSQKQADAASKGVRELREGIEKAAEGVLGDGTEALRRAREELRELSRELKQELDRNAPPEPGNETPGDQPSENQQPGAGTSPTDKPDANSPARPGQGESQSREGQRPGDQPPTENQQPGNNPPNQPQPGQPQPGQSQGGQPQPGAGQPGGQEPGQQPGNPGQRPGEPNQPGQGGERGRPSRNNNPGGPPRGQPAGGGEGTGARQGAPLTGEGFREWSDRLRDVEEMVDDPELRGDAARIRERARGMRAESKRHSSEPNWDLVRQELVRPLVELEQRVSEELLRRTSKKALVPLDRDPVPPEYTEKSRRYYEQLGSGK